MVRVGHTVGDLVRIAELEDKIAELEALLQTPEQRQKTLPKRQSEWDELKAFLENNFRQGYNRGYDMGNRPNE